MKVIDMTPEQLDAAISIAAERPMTANEAFQYCEASGLVATTRPETPRGVFTCDYGTGAAVATSPVLAIKRGFLFNRFGDTVEV